ncbi:hypothetical protein J2Y40_000574 [Chryseobacterium sp. 2987]|nr:hypothetical protein [Chryseobacterium sp. 2987]
MIVRCAKSPDFEPMQLKKCKVTPKSGDFGELEVGIKNLLNLPDLREKIL